MKRFVVALLVAVLASGFTFAQSAGSGFSAWTLSASPSFTLPVSAGDFTANELFASSWGGSMGAEYALPIAIPMALRLGLGYTTGGLLDSGGIAVPGTLSEATILAGASASLKLASRISLLGYFDGGLSYGRLDTGSMEPLGPAAASISASWTR